MLGPDYRGRPRAYRWVAHSAERLAISVTPLRAARTIEEAFDEANGLGTPGQNMVVADRSGRIGWSVYGSIPRRHGPRRQAARGIVADGSRGWDGWLEDAEYPRIPDPPDGRIWTANARVADGDMLAKLGDGSYEIGSRARLIRDRLDAKDHFAPRDLLAIQLDTRARVPRALARRAPAADADAWRRSRAAAARGASARSSTQGWSGAGVARFGRLPAHARVPRRRVRARHRVRPGRVLRGRPHVRLHDRAAAGRGHLALVNRAAAAPARSAVFDLAGDARRRGGRGHRAGDRGRSPGTCAIASGRSAT